MWIDAATLKTLPRRERRAGMAEVIKHAAILDAALFALLEAEVDALLARDEALLPIVVRELRHQGRRGGEDERESGCACSSTSATRWGMRSRA